MRALKVVILGLALVSLSSQASGAVRWLIEAEEFDGLVRYPRWASEEPGWYALECSSYVRDASRQFLACCHDHGKEPVMGKKLPQPLPAGLYTVGLKVYRGRWRPGPNAVEVTLGREKQLYQWQEEQGWIFRRFLLGEPAREITITARKFGQAGLGLLTESRERVILIDAVSIASGEEEFKPEHESLFQRLARWLLSSAWAEELPQGNLMANSSFELGLNDAWACECAGLNTYVLSQKNITSKQAAHGQKALFLPAGARPFSRPIQLAHDGVVTLSAFVRTTNPGQITLALKQEGEKKPTVIFQKSFPVQDKWERVSVSGQVKKGYYFISLSPEKDADFFLDGLQLEYGSLTSYRPRHSLEAAIICPGYGNILYEKKPVLTFSWFNASQQETSAVLNYEVRDIFDQTVLKDAVAFSAAGSGGEKPIVLPLDRYGIFSLTYGLAGRSFPEGETLVVILPQPQPGQHRHNLGANMDCTEPVMKVMARAGFSWQLYCKLHFVYAGNSQPEPGKFVWRDDLIEIPYRNNFKIMACFFPGSIKEWMNDPDNPAGLKRRFTRGTGRGGRIDRPFFPRLDLWQEHVYQVVSHYKNWVKYWCIEDEVEGLWHPQDYAGLVLATVAAAKKADPDCKVGISATPEYTQHLLEYVTASQIDFFGGSSWASGGLAASKIAHLCRRYGKDWYIIGVGRDGQPHFWHTLPGFDRNEARMSAIRTAQEMINMLLLQDAKVIGHYTGRLTNFGQHQTYDFPLLDFSGTPLVHGTVYSVVGQKLQDAVPAGSVSIEGIDREVILFRDAGRLHGVFWLDWTEKAREVTLPEGAGHISVVDFLFTLVPVREEQAALRFSLTPGVPVFFLNQDLSEEKFQAIISSLKSQLPPPAVRATAVFLPEENGLGLYLACHNSCRQPVSGVKLFVGGPYRRKIWLLESQEATVEKVEPGQTVTRKVSLYPDLYQPRFPIELVDIWTYAGDNLFQEGLWLLPAVPASQLARPFVADGRLDEWAGVSPGRIYALCPDWARLSARGGKQIISGGEYLSHPESGDTETACWLAWDQKYLYVAVESKDDQLESGDGVRLVFDLNKASDPFDLKQEKKAIVEVFLPSSGEWKEAWLVTDSGKKKVALAGKVTPPKKIEGLSGRHGGYVVEMALDWSDLGFEPGVWQTFGFDFFQIDVDREEEKVTRSVLHWAAGRKDGGQAVLVPGKDKAE
ncbi:MAG TPA: sugar-binding protein [bacterium]|nr:sugar-binding protein [bacterium]